MLISLHIKFKAFSLDVVIKKEDLESLRQATNAFEIQKVAIMKRTGKSNETVFEKKGKNYKSMLSTDLLNP